MENYILANCTDTGRTRSVNEDSMTTFESPNGRVLVVCDGMGGQNAGDVASQLGVAVIQDILTDNTFATPEEAITRSVMAANQAILRRASQDKSLSGMGATCVMLIVKEGLVYYGSVGDSRIYYVSNGSIRQITKDQSYVQSLVDEGLITKDAAEHHQDKNQITNALGLEGMTPPVVCQIPITPASGSVFLLCSDGLSSMVNNDTILSTLSNSKTPLTARAKRLVELANEAGGLDNITVQLIEFHTGVAAMTEERQGRRPTAAAYVNTEKQKGSKKGLIAIVALLLIAAVGGTAFWLFSGSALEPDSKTQKTPSSNTAREVNLKPEVKEKKEKKEEKEEKEVKRETMKVTETTRANNTVKNASRGNNTAKEAIKRNQNTNTQQNENTQNVNSGNGYVIGLDKNGKKTNDSNQEKPDGFRVFTGEK